MILERANTVFDAWRKGEASGTYELFRAHLTPALQLFSHPLRGRYIGTGALPALLDLVDERTRERNALSFSNIATLADGNSVAYFFDSSGHVRDGAFEYAGFNAIVLGFQRDALSSFQEYFGRVDPSWFSSTR